MSPPSLIPSSFLPHLPRSHHSFDPIPTTDIQGHIAILRELYIPPVHGGFEVADCLVDEDDSSVQRKKRHTKRERRFSAGLVETMDGLGLGLNVPLNSGQVPGGSADLDDLSEHYTSEDEEEEEEVGASKEHLDPFERDWSEKWLNGVVRRSQGWLEDHEGEEHTGDWKVMEGVLKDASAALAMMAGTSGKPFSPVAFDETQLIYSYRFINSTSPISPRPIPRTWLESNSTKSTFQPSIIPSGTYIPIFTIYIAHIPSNSQTTSRLITRISNSLITYKQKEKTNPSSPGLTP
jgi:hypothetical protein